MACCVSQRVPVLVCHWCEQEVCQRDGMALSLDGTPLYQYTMARLYTMPLQYAMASRYRQRPTMPLHNTQHTTANSAVLRSAKPLRAAPAFALAVSRALRACALCSRFCVALCARKHIRAMAAVPRFSSLFIRLRVLCEAVYTPAARNRKAGERRVEGVG